MVVKNENGVDVAKSLDWTALADTPIYSTAIPGIALNGKKVQVGVQIDAGSSTSSHNLAALVYGSFDGSVWVNTGLTLGNVASQTDGVTSWALDFSSLRFAYYRIGLNTGSVTITTKDGATAKFIYAS